MLYNMGTYTYVFYIQTYVILLKYKSVGLEFCASFDFPLEVVDLLSLKKILNCNKFLSV